MNRPPIIRAFGIAPRELVVDNFAGGGGASEGVKRALRRPVDIAINHDPKAIAMHRANNPGTRHYCESVWDVDPVEACGGRPVGFAWFSPDCTHHSRARGVKPRSKEIRGLAWIVIKWARAVAPRIIALENVEEFETWGPLDDDGQPIQAKAGETFRDWLGQLRALGYAVEFRSLVAADYGTPTTRKRLFLIARCDGMPIVWPTPTHGRGRAQPWTPASSIVDWSLPCRSIFDRAKPLAEATLRRIAAGVSRYVVNAAHPFIVETDEGAMSPTLIQTGYGERKGQAPRALDIRRPLGTVVAGGPKHALIAAFITKHYGGVVGHGVNRPLGAITTRDHHALTTATLGNATSKRVADFLERYAERVEPSLFSLLGEERRGPAIVDLKMRMLQPHELFAAQGFPADYDIAPEVDGKPITKTDQYALAGNSVCPQVASAIVAANVYQNAEAAA